MRAKVGLILVVAISLASSLFAYSSRAEDECLVAPNAKAPQASHWHFHRDPIKQRKCWYLRTEGQTMQGGVAGEKPEMIATGKAPAAAITQAARITPDAQPLRSVQDGVRAAPDPATWPDPPSAGTGSVAWPDPRPSAIAPTSGAGTASTTKEEANQKEELQRTNFLTQSEKMS